MANPYATNSILKSLPNKHDIQGSGRSYLSQETRSVKMVAPKTVVPDSPEKTSSRGASFMSILKQRASSVPTTLPSRSLATARTRSVPSKEEVKRGEEVQPPVHEPNEVYSVPVVPSFKPVLQTSQRHQSAPKPFASSLSTQHAPFASSSWRERAAFALSAASTSQGSTAAEKNVPNIHHNTSDTSDAVSTLSHSTLPTSSTANLDQDTANVKSPHLTHSITLTETHSSTAAPQAQSSKRRNKQDENFVRLNMKSRGSYRTRQNHSKTMRKQQKYKNRQFGRFASEPSNSNEEEKPRQKGGIGLSGYGLDALQLSLDAIHTPVSAMPISATVTAPIRRGKYRSTTPAITAPDGTLEELAPMCAQHGMKCKLLIVKKAGGNKGRRFYACSFPSDQRCNFFLWAEDNPHLINHVLAREDTAGDKGWEATALSIYRQRVQQMDSWELRQVIDTMNRSSFGNRIKCSGTREALTIAILEHAEHRLYIDSTGVDDGNYRATTHQELLNEDVSNDENESDHNIAFDSSDSDSIDEDDAVVVSIERQTNAGSTESDVILLSDDSDNEQEADIVTTKDSVRTADIAKEQPREQPRYLLDSATSSVTSSQDPDVVAKRVFGIDSLRDGQRWAINRCIAGLSSLLVLPTGAGKSLPFLLSAVLLAQRGQGLTIVVSPLIALMQDQIRKLPVELPGGCLSSSMTAAEAAHMTSLVLKGHIRILYVSPERLCMPSFRNLIRSLRNRHQQLNDESTGVALMCIDEAHCMSQWSFNFRPSYMRISKEIKYIMPRAVLALTATATPTVRNDIASNLGISAEGTWIASSERSNLCLRAYHVSTYHDKEEMLLSLCQSVEGSAGTKRKIDSKGPMVVYVHRRDEAETINTFVQTAGVKSAAYHAGMPSARRSYTQQQFQRGSVDVIVATIAFGMGIDKSDVRQVVHLNIPKSVENYMQEIGRAGRDGEDATCTLFVNADDTVQQYSLTQSSQVSLLQVLGLLARVFHMSADLTFCNRGSVDIDVVENELGLSGASTETILSLLELDPLQLISVDTNQFDTLSGRIHDPSTISPSDVVLHHLLQLCEKSNATVSNEQSLQYSGKDFNVSLLELSKECHIPIDKLTAILYTKQKEGVLVYRLTGASIYYEIKESKCNFDAVEQYTLWITNLAVTVYQTLKTFVQQSGERVLDMHRMGLLIAKEEISNDRKMKFLCSYLENQCHSTATEHEDMELLQSFHAVDIPVESADLAGKNDSTYDIVVQCRRNIAIAMRNPVITNLTSALENIILSRIQHVALAKSMKENLRQSSVNFRAVCVAHVLHGHASKLVVASEWSDCEFWGRFRNVSFDSIVCLASTLLAK